VLTPEMAREKYLWVRREIPELSVVGIAGPGDALAEWQNTKKTISLIKKEDKDMVFCLSTNGLLLPEYAADIVDLGIQHVTVTVNATDPEIGSKIYNHIFHYGRFYQGTEAAQLLWENQRRGITYLTARGVLVKINIVMIKGINESHIPDVVKTVKDLGVFITNIMPLIPAAGSAFEHFPQTSMKEVNDLRNLCQIDIQQLRHCQQCRADAIGKLGEDRSQEFRMCHRLSESAKPKQIKKQYRIAVASKYGKMVDLHFGHANEFIIFEGNGESFAIVERRPVDKYCAGMAECYEGEEKRDAIIDALKDCRAVMTMRIGQHAKEKLHKRGIFCVEYCDTVENGLRYTVELLLAQPLSEGKMA
jgi:nitrogen fixation protein NifB